MRRRATERGDHVNRPRSFRGSLICLVTDRHRLAPRENPEAQLDKLVAQAAEAGRAGVDLIQLRERDLDGGVLTRLARRMIDAATPAKVIINDRADVALQQVPMALTFAVIRSMRYG